MGLMAWIAVLDAVIAVVTTVLAVWFIVTRLKRAIRSEVRRLERPRMTFNSLQNAKGSIEAIKFRAAALVAGADAMLAIGGVERWPMSVFEHFDVAVFPKHWVNPRRGDFKALVWTIAQLDTKRGNLVAAAASLSLEQQRAKLSEVREAADQALWQFDATFPPEKQRS